MEAEKVAWEVKEWGRATSTCVAKVYMLIADKTIRSAKLGKKRVILTPPREYVEQHEVV